MDMVLPQYEYGDLKVIYSEARGSEWIRCLDTKTGLHVDLPVELLVRLTMDLCNRAIDLRVAKKVCEKAGYDVKERKWC